MYLNHLYIHVYVVKLDLKLATIVFYLTLNPYHSIGDIFYFQVYFHASFSHRLLLQTCVTDLSSINCQAREKSLVSEWQQFPMMTV